MRTHERVAVGLCYIRGIGGVSAHPRLRVARTRRVTVILVLAAAVVIVDALSKHWARTDLSTRGREFGPVDLSLGSNTGVAFGIGAGAPRWLVALVTALIIATLTVVAVKLRPAVAAGLVVGGGLANLVDRIGDGAVTDFIAVPHWPTFNLADTAITCGAAWLGLAAIRTSTHTEEHTRA